MRMSPNSDQRMSAETSYVWGEQPRIRTSTICC
jgi:hypothetical protein